MSGKVYYTDKSFMDRRVSTVAMATTKHETSSATANTTDITDNKGALGISKTNLILVIVGIIGFLTVIVLVFILLWCKLRRRKMRSVTPSKVIEPVYPIRSLAEPLVTVVPSTPAHAYDYPVELKPQYEIPDQEYLYDLEDNTQLIPPLYRHGNLQPQPSTQTQMTENEYSDIQAGRQRPRPGQYNKLNEGFPTTSNNGYDKIVKVDPHPYDMIGPPPMSPNTEVEDMRYNVLNRHGKSDEPYRYNVLSRGL